MRPRLLLSLATALALLLPLGAATPAGATVIAGDSSAFGLYVDLEIPILPDLFLDGTPAVSGSAPAPYDLSDSLLTYDGTVIDLGLLEVAAASDVDGGLGIRFAEASAGLKNLAINVGSAFSLELSAIGADARSEGDFGALVSTGDALLASLLVTVGGSVIFDGAVAPGANTDFLDGILDPLGIDLILNEQILSGDGISTTGIAVNAVHLLLDTPLLAGEVIFSHAESSLQAVPEPGTWILVLLALAPLAAWRRA